MFTATHQTLRSLVLFLAFISGFSIMAVELLGGRILAPYFGSSIYVWGSVITVFMVALSAGYLLGGRLSLRNPTMRRFSYCYLLGALALLPLVLAGEALMNQVFLYISDPRYGSLLAAMMLFFLPTLILGVISPYAIRLLVRNSHHSGQIAGMLYFVSTFGSALGTLATSFYLVLWFEVHTILYSLIALLGGGGLIAFFIHTPHVATEGS